MSYFSGFSSHTWQPTMTSITTTPSYWLNWRFFLCSLWILASISLASFLILKYERCNNTSRHDDDDERGENQQEDVALVYEDEAWSTCLRGIDPSWLLVYRIIAFLVLLALIFASVAANGAAIFYFYTQWTFTLVTIYFGLGSSFSLYGCLYKHNKFGDNTPKSPNGYEDPHARKIAGLWGYIFQIIFQICAGAVLLTDSVFWFVIYPLLLTSKDYSLDFLVFCMHSINAVFLLGDTSLNCLRFPMFRFAYFVFWTAIFVIFQWIVHACVSTWWPYPFLDLSSSYAPLWYLAVALMHIPCYGFFSLIVRLKHFWLSSSFPGSSRFVP